MGADLAGEEFVEPVVVGDAGDGGDVGGEGDGREGVPFPFIAARRTRRRDGRHPWRCLRCRRAALCVLRERPLPSVCDLDDAIGMLAGELLLDGRAFGKRLEYMLFHGKQF